MLPLLVTRDGHATVTDSCWKPRPLGTVRIAERKSFSTAALGDVSHGVNRALPTARRRMR